MRSSEFQSMLSNVSQYGPDEILAAIYGKVLIDKYGSLNILKLIEYNTLIMRRDYINAIRYVKQNPDIAQLTSKYTNESADINAILTSLAYYALINGTPAQTVKNELLEYPHAFSRAFEAYAWNTVERLIKTNRHSEAIDFITTHATHLKTTETFKDLAIYVLSNTLKTNNPDLINNAYSLLKTHGVITNELEKELAEKASKLHEAALEEIYKEVSNKIKQYVENKDERGVKKIMEEAGEFLKNINIVINDNVLPYTLYDYLVNYLNVLDAEKSLTNYQQNLETANNLLKNNPHQAPKLYEQAKRNLINASKHKDSLAFMRYLGKLSAGEKTTLEEQKNAIENEFRARILFTEIMSNIATLSSKYDENTATETIRALNELEPLSHILFPPPDHDPKKSVLELKRSLANLLLMNELKTPQNAREFYGYLRGEIKGSFSNKLNQLVTSKDLFNKENAELAVASVTIASLTSLGTAKTKDDVDLSKQILAYSINKGLNGSLLELYNFIEHWTIINHSIIGYNNIALEVERLFNKQDTQKSGLSKEERARLKGKLNDMIQVSQNIAKMTDQLLKATPNILAKLKTTDDAGKEITYRDLIEYIKYRFDMNAKLLSEEINVMNAFEKYESQLSQLDSSSSISDVNKPVPSQYFSSVISSLNISLSQIIERLSKLKQQAKNDLRDKIDERIKALNNVIEHNAYINRISFYTINIENNLKSVINTKLSESLLANMEENFRKIMTYWSNAVEYYKLMTTKIQEARESIYKNPLLDSTTKTSIASFYNELPTKYMNMLSSVKSSLVSKDSRYANLLNAAENPYAPRKFVTEKTKFRDILNKMDWKPDEYIIPYEKAEKYVPALEKFFKDYLNAARDYYGSLGAIAGVIAASGLMRLSPQHVGTIAKIGEIAGTIPVGIARAVFSIFTLTDTVEGLKYVVGGVPIFFKHLLKGNLTEAMKTIGAPLYHAIVSSPGEFIGMIIGSALLAKIGTAAALKLSHSIASRMFDAVSAGAKAGKIAKFLSPLLVNLLQMDPLGLLTDYLIISLRMGVAKLSVVVAPLLGKIIDASGVSFKKIADSLSTKAKIMGRYAYDLSDYVSKHAKDISQALEIIRDFAKSLAEKSPKLPVNVIRIIHDSLLQPMAKIKTFVQAFDHLKNFVITRHVADLFTADSILKRTVNEIENFVNTLRGSYKDLHTVLKIYRYIPEEKILKKILQLTPDKINNIIDTLKRTLEYQAKTYEMLRTQVAVGINNAFDALRKTLPEISEDFSKIVKGYSAEVEKLVSGHKFASVTELNTAIVKLGDAIEHALKQIADKHGIGASLTIMKTLSNSLDEVFKNEPKLKMRIANISRMLDELSKQETLPENQLSKIIKNELDIINREVIENLAKELDIDTRVMRQTLKQIEPGQVDAVAKIMNDLVANYENLVKTVENTAILEKIHKALSTIDKSLAKIERHPILLKLSESKHIYRKFRQTLREIREKIDVASQNVLNKMKSVLYIEYTYRLNNILNELKETGIEPEKIRRLKESLDKVWEDTVNLRLTTPRSEPLLRIKAKAKPVAPTMEPELGKTPAIADIVREEIAIRFYEKLEELRKQGLFTRHEIEQIDSAFTKHWKQKLDKTEMHPTTFDADTLLREMKNKLKSFGLSDKETELIETILRKTHEFSKQYGTPDHITMKQALREIELELGKLTIDKYYNLLTTMDNVITRIIHEPTLYSIRALLINSYDRMIMKLPEIQLPDDTIKAFETLKTHVTTLNIEQSAKALLIENIDHVIKTRSLASAIMFIRRIGEELDPVLAAKMDLNLVRSLINDIHDKIEKIATHIDANKYPLGTELQQAIYMIRNVRDHLHLIETYGRRTPVVLEAYRTELKGFVEPSIPNLFKQFVDDLKDRVPYLSRHIEKHGETIIKFLEHLKDGDLELANNMIKEVKKSARFFINLGISTDIIDKIKTPWKSTFNKLKEFATKTKITEPLVHANIIDNLFEDLASFSKIEKGFGVIAASIDDIVGKTVKMPIDLIPELQNLISKKTSVFYIKLGEHTIAGTRRVNVAPTFIRIRYQFKLPVGITYYDLLVVPVKRPSLLRPYGTNSVLAYLYYDPPTLYSKQNIPILKGLAKELANPDEFLSKIDPQLYSLITKVIVNTYAGWTPLNKLMLTYLPLIGSILDISIDIANAGMEQLEPLVALNTPSNYELYNYVMTKGTPPPPELMEQLKSKGIIALRIHGPFIVAIPHPDAIKPLPLSRLPIEKLLPTGKTASLTVVLPYIETAKRVLYIIPDFNYISKTIPRDLLEKLTRMITLEKYIAKLQPTMPVTEHAVPYPLIPLTPPIIPITTPLGIGMGAKSKVEESETEKESPTITLHMHEEKELLQL